MLFMKNLEKVAQVAPGLARSISQINQVNGQVRNKLCVGTVCVQKCTFKSHFSNPICTYFRVKEE